MSILHTIPRLCPDPSAASLLNVAAEGGQDGSWEESGPYSAKAECGVDAATLVSQDRPPSYRPAERREGKLDVLSVPLPWVCQNCLRTATTMRCSVPVPLHLVDHPAEMARLADPWRQI